MAPHQRGARLDGDQGAQIAHVDPAMIQLLGLEDPLGRRLDQALQPGIQAMLDRSAEGDDMPELGAGCGLLAGQDGGGEQAVAQPLFDAARHHGVLQLGLGQAFAAPVRGELGGGAHGVLLDHHQHAGVVALGDGHGGMGAGVRVGQQGVEQADGLPDPLAQRLIAPTVGRQQQGQDLGLGDGMGEAGGDAQADQRHVGR
ncbi:hypothetical protein D3C85_585650 [compost metagenome]